MILQITPQSLLNGNGGNLHLLGGDWFDKTIKMNKNTLKTQCWNCGPVLLVLWHLLTTGPFGSWYFLSEQWLVYWIKTERSGGLLQDLPGLIAFLPLLLNYVSSGFNRHTGFRCFPPKWWPTKIPLGWWGVKVGQAQKKVFLVFWSFSWVGEMLDGGTSRSCNSQGHSEGAQWQSVQLLWSRAVIGWVRGLCLL